MLELSNLCHCVQHPWKLTSRDFCLGTQESHFLQLKHVSRKCSGVSQKQWILELSNFAIVFKTPENLLVGISGALGTQESHFLSWNMFWENAMEYLRNGACLELSNLCHCVQHPWKLTGRDFWSSRNTRKPLSKLKHVLRKCCGVSQKQWMLELSNLCALCSAPLKTY